MILAETLGALYNMSIVLVAGVIFFIIGSLITDWREYSVVESQHACSEARNPKKAKKERCRSVLRSCIARYCLPSSRFFVGLVNKAGEAS